MGTVVDLKMAAAGDEQPNPDAPLFTFDALWALYPRRVARKDALKAWLRIAPENHPKIFAAVERTKKTDDWRRENGQFVPYLASYLNGERWTDELEGDLTMGECKWNVNNNREPGRPKCSKAGVREKNGVVYCSEHIVRVNG